MKKTFLTFLFNLIIYGLPLYLIISISVYYYQYYLNNTPKINIGRTVGCVKGRTTGRGPHSDIVEFTFKGKIYKAETSLDCEYGEKFIVEFEKGNPKINRVNQDEPVFLKKEKTNFTIGIVNNYNPNYFRRISFIYFVDGKKYEQSYKPVEDSKIKYPNLKEGKKYKVRYWEENPQRSIILLDKPDSSYIEYN